MTRLALREAKAAAALDMPPARFRSLVDDGTLPPPVRLGDVELWAVRDLEAALTGKTGMEAVEW